MNKHKILLPTLLLWCVCYLPDWSQAGWAQGRIYTVQVASFPTEAEAKREVAKLTAAGLPGHWVKANVPGKGTRYRVRFGRFNSQEEAKAGAEQALKRGTISEYIFAFYEAPADPRRDTKLAAEKAEKAEKAKAEKAELALNKKAAPEPAKPEPVKPESAKPESVKPEPVKPAAPPKAEPAVVKPAGNEPAPTPMKEPVKEPVKKESVKEAANKKGKTKNAAETPKAAEAVVKPTPTPTTQLAVNAPKPAEPAKQPEPKTEPEPVPVAASNKPPEPDKVSPVPRIAQPPLADALGEVDITNHNWKIARKSVATDKNLRAIYFVDSMTGWAAGDAGALYRTTDGGKAWKPLLSGAAASINQIQFVDWNNGWMLGEVARRDDGEPETVVLSTTNGGRSWTKKSLPNVLSIFFTDAQNGWAVGRNATILKTEDGGNEWKPYTDLEKVIGLPVESSNYNFGFRDIFFLDAQRGWLIGNFYGRAKSHIGGLFVTNDGGVTWKRLPLTVQTQYTSGRFTPGVFHSVRFSDQNTGSVTGEMQDGEGRFFFALHTRDGGKSWEQFRTPSRAAHSTQFVSAATGWTAAAAPREGGADAVVYDTTLMRTDNGGASWQYDFVARGSRIRGVYFLSPAKGWAVGDRGMILRYEDKSKTN